MFVQGNPLEREAQRFGVTLECRELLHTMVRDIDYRIPETLRVRRPKYHILTSANRNVSRRPQTTMHGHICSLRPSPRTVPLNRPDGYL